MSEIRTTEQSRRGEVEAAREEAEQTLEGIEQERQALSVEAISGDKEAADKLEKLERAETEAARTRALADAAIAELDRREEEERQAAEEQRREGLSTRYDELARGRKKLLSAVEKALDTLENKAAALLEHDQEQRDVLEAMGYQHGQGPYDYILRDRILARLGRFLGGVPGAASSRSAPLTEDDFFTRTMGEEAAAKERGLREAEEARAEDERIREASERAEKIRDRRHALQAALGYGDAHPAERVGIEDQVEQMLRQEFETQEV